MRKGLLFCIALLLLCAPAKRGSATSVLKLDPGRLFAGAKLVVAGEVISLKPRAAPEEIAPVVTEVVLRVESIIKGNADPLLVFVVPGGRIGDRGVMIPGTPVFEIGDRVLLALERDRRGVHRVRGFFQGRFTLVSLKGSPDLVAVQDPWKALSGPLAACAGASLSCLDRVPATFTLDRIRQLAGARP